MKRKRYEEGGEVEDVEKGPGDYDDERPSGSGRLRFGPSPAPTPRAESKPAPRPAPRAESKPAPKPAPAPTPAPVARAETPRPAPKPAAEAPKSSRTPDFIDKLPPNHPLRKLRARGTGETEGPYDREYQAQQEKYAEGRRQGQERLSKLGSNIKEAVFSPFRAIRERGQRDLPPEMRAKGYAKGGSVSASRRADGIARKGKTRGKVI